MSAAAVCSAAAVSLHAEFDSLGFGPATWAAVAAQGDTRTVFQDWYWQRAWWRSFGRGELVILVGRDGDRVAAIAPLFIDGGMAYLVGSGGSDYLDFIGDLSPPGLLDAMLRRLLQAHPELAGIVLYLVPDASRTGALVQQAAARLGLACFDQGPLPAPAMSMPDEASALRAANKASLLRHARKLGQAGGFCVLNLRSTAQILPWLDRFFEQHVRRWRDTGVPSLFNDPAQRAFYRALAESADRCGWLRLMVVLSRGEPVAFHFGMAHGGRFLWYKPSFDIRLARQSPGEVLLRQLILAAREEGASCFDFGLGDEAFKRRFADQWPLVRTWGLYPCGSGAA